MLHEIILISSFQHVICLGGFLHVNDIQLHNHTRVHLLILHINIRVICWSCIYNY